MAKYQYKFYCSDVYIVALIQYRSTLNIIIMEPVHIFFTRRYLNAFFY